ncbi:UPF0149 family protein [Chelativorans alearense]|uniref:UPF0149 family protein n=1 Tax=Chelativorans alearense TaxID=2681495 RepID=UPI0013D766B8|nr:UPF0149 family protein [Chelativorans alearense]
MPSIPQRLKLLDKQLAGLPENSDPMLISEFDGFLAGILVCPDLIMPGEWLPMVWGGTEEDAAPVFDNAGQLEKVVGLLMEHYNATADDLHRGRYAPVFDVDPRHDEILWEFWIDGFEAAMQLRPVSWAAMLESDEDTQIALAGLVALTEISRNESRLSKPEADDLAENAPELIAHWVETLNAWRLTQHSAGQPGQPEPSFGKVGRNDPCPCGSGKKYKKCCGSN